MQTVDLRAVETMDMESALDPTRRLRVAFPISSATGAAASASVYFELEPGCLVGDEVAPVAAGQIVVVPAMVRHDITNTGDGVLRVLGTFAGSTVVATFEEPVQTSVGIRHVLVNGVPVVRDGAVTGARPGRALRR